MRFATHGYTPDVLNTPEGRAFLDRVEALPDGKAKAAARGLKDQLPAFAARGEKLREEFEARLRPTPPDEGRQDVSFRRLQLNASSADGRNLSLDRFGGAFRAGRGDGPLPRGRLALPDAGEGPPGVDLGAERPPFRDQRRRLRRPLCLGDPRGTGPGAGPDGHRPEDRRSVGVHGGGRPASEGGKIAARQVRPQHPRGRAPLPGKACVVGFFGRTYLAIATFGPDLGKTFEIFHEAREAPDPEDRQQWRKATTRFAPQYLLPVFGRVRPDAPEETRILLGRDEVNIDTWYHPLVVDPERRTVEVLPDRIDPGGQSAFSVRDGGAFWAWPDTADRGRNGHAKCVWRVGFPDFRRTLVARDIYQGRSDRVTVGIFEGRSVAGAERLLVAESPEGPYRPLRGVVPLPAQQSSYQLLSTNHYGLLLKTFGSELFEAEFREVERPSGANPRVETPHPSPSPQEPETMNALSRRLSIATAALSALASAAQAAPQPAEVYPAAILPFAERGSAPRTSGRRSRRSSSPPWWPTRPSRSSIARRWRRPSRSRA